MFNTYYAGAIVFLALVNIYNRQGNCDCQCQNTLNFRQKTNTCGCMETNPCFRENPSRCNRCGKLGNIDYDTYYAYQYGYYPDGGYPL